MKDKNKCPKCQGYKLTQQATCVACRKALKNT